MKNRSFAAVSCFILLTSVMAGALIGQENWEEDFANLAGQKVADPYLRIKELSEEISLLNLVNGLHLTREQMEQIVDLSQRSQELIVQALREHSGRGRKLEAALEALRSTLEDPDRTIPQELEEKAQGLEKEIKQAKHELKKQLRALEEELSGVLSLGQLEVIREFAPCLIPPRNLKNPVRVGQAGGELAELVMHLEHVRNLPEKPYQVLIEPILGKILDEWEVLFNFSPRERRQEVQRLKGIVEQARTLPDLKFALEKEILASRFMQPFSALRETSNEISDFFARMGGLSKPGKWLLNPRVIAILEERLRRPEPRLKRTARAELPDPGCEDTASFADQAEMDEAAGFCPCGKPTFALFCSRFHVDCEHREACREAIAKGQIRLLNLLSEETEEGEVPLVLLFMQPERLGDILTRPIPGRRTTYAGEAESIVLDIHRGLEKHMARDAMNEFRSSGFDLFELHVGNLNRFVE